MIPPTCQVVACFMVQAHPVLPAQRCRCGDGRLPLVLLVMVIASALTAAAAPFALRPGPDVSTAASLGQLTCFDYNGDGQADVVGINARDGALTVIPRTTSGYGPPAAAGSLADPHGTVVAGDVTGDGIADLLGQDGLDILWWQGHSSSVATPGGVLFELVEEHIELFGAADLDGNGLDDLVFGGIVRVEDFTCVTTPPQVFFQASPGVFQKTVLPFEPQDGVRPVSLIDANGDGVRDLTVGACAATTLVRFPTPGQIVTEPLEGSGELGDFNGDGRVDRFCLFHDLSTGTLKPQITHSAADARPGETIQFDAIALLPGRRQSVVGDFDGDGLTEALLLVPYDPAGATGNGRMIQWNGTGYMTGAFYGISGMNPYEVLSTAMGLSAQDLDRDGADEVVMVNPAVRMQDALGNPVALGIIGYELADLVELSPGLWTFSTPVRRITDNHHPVAIRRLDANRDGIEDLVSLGGADGRLMGWKSGPDGALEPRGWFYRSTGEVGASLVAADFVGRGTVGDAAMTFINPAVTYSSHPWASRFVHGRPYFDDGTSLGEREVEALGSGQYPMLVVGSGDFDGDGRIDVLTINRDFGELSWRRNEGVSTGNRVMFGDCRTIALAGLIRDQLGRLATIDGSHVVVCDTDADGDPDIITYPSAFGNAVALHRNSGSGSFALETLPVAPAGAPRGLLRADMNGDGLADLVAMTSGVDLIEETVITVAESLGSGPINRISFPFSCGKVTAGDFDADGRDELVLGGSLHFDALGNPALESAMLLVRTSADGKLSAPVVVSESQLAPSDFLVDDTNADGRPDLVVASEIGGTISVFLNEAAPSWPGYAAWAAANGLAQDSMSTDPDHDGRDNLEEYAAGTDPMLPELPTAAMGLPGTPPLLSIGSNSWGWPELRARHQRPKELAAGKLEVALERSTDMRNWSPVEHEPSISWDPDHPGWEIRDWTRTLRVPALVSDPSDPPAAYYRFRLVYTP